MSTKVLDAARTNEEGGWSLNEGQAWMEPERGTSVDGARKSDEVWMQLQQAPKVRMQLKRVKRVDVTRTRDKGGCSLNE